MMSVGGQGRSNVLTMDTIYNVLGPAAGISALARTLCHNGSKISGKQENTKFYNRINKKASLA